MKRRGDTTGDGDTSERSRYVFCEKPSCPQCGEKQLRTLRSRSEGGGVTRRTECLNRRCRHKFFIVWE